MNNTNSWFGVEQAGSKTQEHEKNTLEVEQKGFW